jgi:hypothetical protein
LIRQTKYEVGRKAFSIAPHSLEERSHRHAIRIASSESSKTLTPRIWQMGASIPFNADDSGTTPKFLSGTA